MDQVLKNELEAYMEKKGIYNLSSESDTTVDAVEPSTPIRDNSHLSMPKAGN